MGITSYVKLARRKVNAYDDKRKSVQSILAFSLYPGTVEDPLQRIDYSCTVGILLRTVLASERG
eukprot:COSAG02_NODE_1391_length_12911_cov_246.579145_7_plen_64_part_00